MLQNGSCRCPFSYFPAPSPAAQRCGKAPPPEGRDADSHCSSVVVRFLIDARFTPEVALLHWQCCYTTTAPRADVPPNLRGRSCSCSAMLEVPRSLYRFWDYDILALQFSPVVSFYRYLNSPHVALINSGPEDPSSTEP